MALINEKEIRERWNSRVVPNNWHNMPDGAALYLKKYGKGISEEKVEAFMNYSRYKSESFYNGMKEHLDYMISKRKAREAIQKLH